jgi:hypothetical protein
MVALLLGPKTAILRKDLGSDTALRQGLTFLAVSFGITYIAEIPLLPAGLNKEVTFGALAVQAALAVSLNAAALILAWKIVGGKLAPKKIVVATCYFSGVSTILFLGFYLVAAGAFKTLDPITYQQMMSGAATDPIDLWSNSAVRVFGYLIVLGFAVTTAWIFGIWGAYRQLMQIDKLRSGIALSLFMAVSPILIAVQLLMGAVVMQARAGPPVPNDIVGQWQGGSQTTANGALTTHLLWYSFAAPRYKLIPVGSYHSVETHRSDNAKCVVIVQQSENGFAVVRGTTITLTATHRTQSTKDGCTGKTSETSIDLTKSEFQYQIDKQPAGWTLCLNNRFGQACLTPKKP